VLLLTVSLSRRRSNIDCYRGANSTRVALDGAIRPAVQLYGQAPRRRLAFFEAPLVAVFLPTVLR
jgi:hypothetical protein